MLAASEDAAMCAPVGERQSELPAAVRSIALTFLGCLCRNAGVPILWPEAVALFDAYSARKPQKAQACLPATCFAVVVSLLQFEGDNDNSYYSTLIDAGSISGLARLGFRCSAEGILEESKPQCWCLLRTMEGNIKVPTLQSWVAAYTKRLDICMHFMFAASLAWSCSNATTYAQRILMQQSLVNKKPQRHTAAGLFALSLMQAGLIHVHSLRPSCLNAEQWEDLILQSGVTRKVPELGLPQDDAARVLTMLQVATACSVADLQVGTCAALQCKHSIVASEDKVSSRTYVTV
eukprot:TRINITY_DN12374_c0_g3_i1.p1 TRINITY_DN12374_c0_g3~~TRINITY_DN12374_c0_g3_i1.p1  ORF type:complete len:292 (-),score=31.91 TRINITY_DN12374_c0_g3_i1:450-1325(-)